MKIAIGADHGGFQAKEEVVKFLKEAGHKVKNFGTNSTESCDYPLIAYEVAKGVSAGKFDRGVLICKSGIGMTIAANKLPGVRAAAVYNEALAISSRQHNDANIIVFAASFNSIDEIKEWLDIWLKTETGGGRHKRRVDQIQDIEKKTGGK